jgi:hypothetical protein
MLKGGGVTTMAEYTYPVKPISIVSPCKLDRAVRDKNTDNEVYFDTAY